jgi:hypothetical protein
MNDKVVGGARSTKGRGELLLPCSLLIPAKIQKVQGHTPCIGKNDSQDSN